MSKSSAWAIGHFGLYFEISAQNIAMITKMGSDKQIAEESHEAQSPLNAEAQEARQVKSAAAPGGSPAFTEVPADGGATVGACAGAGLVPGVGSGRGSGDPGRLHRQAGGPQRARQGHDPLPPVTPGPSAAW